MENPISLLQAIDPHKHFATALDSEIRFDQRSFNESRNRSITYPQSTKSGPIFGSAMVTMGSKTAARAVGTKCLTNISMQIGTPSLSKPDEGDVVFDVMLTPGLSRKYDTEQQRKKHNDAIDLEAFLRDVFCPNAAGSNANSTQTQTHTRATFDLKQLCIERGKRAFRLVVSVLFLSVDGNMQDCAITSVDAALRNTTIPVVTGSGVNSRLTRQDGKQLVMKHNITANTFAIYSYKTAFTTSNNNSKSSQSNKSKVFLIDPTKNEEDLVRNTVTIVTGDRGILKGVFMDAVENCGALCNGITYDSGLSEVEMQSLIQQAHAFSSD